MLIGVLCDVVSTVKEEESTASDIALIKQELLHLLVACDESGDGEITQQELDAVMSVLQWLVWGCYFRYCHILVVVIY